MLLAPWLEAVRSSLIFDRFRRREKKRPSRFRNLSNPLEVLEDRTLLTVQVIGGEDPPIANVAVGNVTPLEITHDLLPTERATDTVTLTFDANESPTADIVFIVDESGSMSGEQAWIDGMVTSLDTSLSAAGVTNNRYSLVGYLAEGTLFSMTAEPITVSIYGPDGTQLESQTLSAKTTTGLLAGNFTLPETGAYTILVDRDGGSNPYSYSFVVQDDSPTPAGGTATLALDELSEGRIETDGAAHTYTFSLAQAETLFFESLTSNTDLRWSLDGPSGAVVTDRDFDLADLQVSAAAGSYTLTVDGPAGATGAYAYRLLNLTGTAIATGTAVSGTLNPATSSAVYELSATAGDRFYFDAQTTGAPAGARWRLIDPAGTVLFNQALGDDQDVITAAATGTHYLLIDGDVADTAATRGFDFKVWAPTADSSTALVLGTAVSGAIDTAGERDAYTFTLASDAVLALDSRTNDANLTWSLSEATNGTVITGVGFAESDLILRLAAGSYTLTVDPAGTTTGAYAFNLLDTSAATALTVGSTTNGNLNPATSTAAYKFTAAAGDKYSFDAITWAGSASARWRLIDPFGNELFGAALGSDVGALHLHAAGDYTVLLEGAIDDAASNPAFSFQVVSQGSDTSDPAPLALSQISSGVISTSGESDDYTFTLGTTTRVAFDSLTNRGDMSWSLSDGTTTLVSSRALDASDATGVSDANSVLSLSVGTYTLTLAADTGVTGDYAFALLDLGTAATTITAGNEVSGRLSASHRTTVYEFTATAGDRFAFQSLEWSGGANATWRLVDSSGTVLTSGALDESIGLFALATGGTYQLLVEGTLDDSAVTRGYRFQVDLETITDKGVYSGPKSDTISTAGDVYAYSIAAQAGERYVIDFTSAASTDFYVSIRDIAGNEVTRAHYDSAAQPTSVVTAEMAAGGTYHALVGADNGATGSFAFRLVEFVAGTNDTGIDADTAGDFTLTGERDVFYFSGEAGQDLQLRIDAWGTAAEAAAASTRLVAYAQGTEDGYDGIDEALQHLQFRDGAAKHFVLITDEDRDVTAPNLTKNDIFTAIQAAGATLHSIVDLGIDTTNQTENALGLDVDDTAFFVAAGGGYTSAASGGATFPRYGSSGSFEYTSNVDTEVDYVELSFDTGGPIGISINCVAAATQPTRFPRRTLSRRRSCKC